VEDRSLSGTGPIAGHLEPAAGNGQLPAKYIERRKTAIIYLFLVKWGAGHFWENHSMLEYQLGVSHPGL